MKTYAASLCTDAYQHGIEVMRMRHEDNFRKVYAYTCWEGHCLSS